MRYQRRAEAIAAAPETADTYDATGTNSLLVVPSRGGGRIVGCLKQNADKLSQSCQQALASLRTQH